MGESRVFPIDADTKGITGRDGYIVAEALYLATQWIEHLPAASRPEADKRDMLRILDAAFPDWENTFLPP